MCFPALLISLASGFVEEFGAVVRNDARKDWMNERLNEWLYDISLEMTSDSTGVQSQSYVPLNVDGLSCFVSFLGLVGYVCWELDHVV